MCQVSIIKIVADRAHLSEWACQLSQRRQNLETVVVSHQAHIDDSEFFVTKVASRKFKRAMIQITAVSRCTLCTLLVGFRIGNPKIDLCLHKYSWLKFTLHGCNSCCML